MRVTCDIEGNGLLLDITEVFCICIKIKDKVYEFGPDHVHHGLDILQDAETVVGHNFIGYDLPALKSVMNFDYHGRVIDTMLLSQIMHQERPRGHSLDAWGERVGYPKLQHYDWTQFSPEMLRRCTRDVQITEKILEVLEQEAGVQIIGTSYEYNQQDLGL